MDPLLQSFFEHARDDGQAPALVWRGRKITYEVLAAMAVQTLRRLDTDDVEAIGIVAKKSPAVIAAVIACMMAGRPFLLASADLGDVARASLFAKARCRQVL